MTEPVLAFRQSNELAEGPVWDDRTHTLYWVDIPSGTQWRSVRRASGYSEPEAWRPADWLAAVGLADGSFVGAVADSVAQWRWGEPAVPLAPASFGPDVCFNDGKVGPDGAFWIGSKDRAHRQPVGLLERVGPGHRQRLETGLTISNGLDWSPDLRWFYLTDSVPRVIWRYRYDQETGSLSGRELFADGSEAPGVPDGLAVDSEGCVWSARWGGSQIVRLSPGGQVLARIAFPVSLVSSCAFGGPDLKTLFVTTAREQLTPAQRRTEVLAGSVFSLETEVPGLPAFRFSTTFKAKEPA